MSRPAAVLLSVLLLGLPLAGVAVAEPEAPAPAAPSGSEETRASPGPDAPLTGEDLEAAREAYEQMPAARSGKGEKPSGMWGGTRERRGAGAYRWPYLVIGAIACVVAAFVLVFYIRKLERERRRA